MIPPPATGADCASGKQEVCVDAWGETRLLVQPLGVKSGVGSGSSWRGRRVGVGVRAGAWAYFGPRPGVGSRDGDVMFDGVDPARGSVLRPLVLSGPST